MKLFLIIPVALLVSSLQPSAALRGSWQYAGGVYNGKKEGAPDGYSLRRNYTDTSYQAFVIQEGYKPEKYEAGRYALDGDTCVDTETFCSQPSEITNIPIHYLYAVRNDTVIFKGVLPSGMRIEEYWKKIK